MKNFIFLVMLVVAGYFASQYFIGLSQHDSTPPVPTFNQSFPSIPEECQENGEDLEDAIHDHELGKLTIVEFNQYTSRFQSCLLAAGFTNSQINRTYDRIKQIALSTDPDN